MNPLTDHRAPKSAQEPAVRGHFGRSALVRQLAAHLPAQPEASRQDLAERLGEWLNVADAIDLHAALQALPATRTRPSARRQGAAELQDALQRLRATLQQAIAVPPSLAVEATDTAFAPHHQRCLDQQRRMEAAIEALRGHVRDSLSATSPALAQLASLDATLDRLLGGREQALLSGLPALLKQRFEQLRQAQPETWPAAFEQALQQALLAELELRLQPVTGMIEALGQAEAPN